MVDKDVSAVISSNEAKAFAVVEPLHRSLCHACLPPFLQTKISEGLKKRGHKAKSLCDLFRTQKLLKFHIQHNMLLDNSSMHFNNAN
jgi:hypothetical protein